MGSRFCVPSWVSKARPGAQWDRARVYVSVSHRLPLTSCHQSKGSAHARHAMALVFLNRRNQNYMNILRFLALGDKKLSPFNITHRFTHLFWLGDLNYRVELPTWVRRLHLG